MQLTVHNTNDYYTIYSEILINRKWFLFYSSDFIASVLPDFIRSDLTEEEKEEMNKRPIYPKYSKTKRVLKRTPCQN